MEHSLSLWPRRVLWFCLLATVGCVADLWSKQLVFSSSELFHGSEWWLIDGHIGIQKSLNEGALFGMGQGKVWLFGAFSILAAIAIPFWLFYYRAAEDFWLTTSLGCIMGGVLGNFYDRAGFSGLTWGMFDPARRGETVYAVRDWILFQASDQWVWPNFNIADALLVCGAIGLALRSFFIAPDRAVPTKPKVPGGMP